MQNIPVFHVLDRYKEKFTNHYKESLSNFGSEFDFEIKFTIKDYKNLSVICRDDSTGDIVKLKKKDCFKKFIVYNKTPMWVIYTSKKKIVKTIYPVKSKEIRIMRTNTQRQLPIDSLD